MIFTQVSKSHFLQEYSDDIFPRFVIQLFSQDDKHAHFYLQVREKCWNITKRTNFNKYLNVKVKLI